MRELLKGILFILLFFNWSDNFGRYSYNSFFNDYCYAMCSAVMLYLLVYTADAEVVGEILNAMGPGGVRMAEHVAIQMLPDDDGVIGGREVGHLFVGLLENPPWHLREELVQGEEHLAGGLVQVHVEEAPVGDLQEELIPIRRGRV